MRLVQLLSLIFFLTINLSCSPKEETPATGLVVSVDKILFEASTETKSLHIKSNVDWQISGSPTWCTVTPSSGKKGTNKVDISIEQNETVNVRTATLIITSGKESKNVIVEQAGKTVLNVSKLLYEPDAEGEELTLTVESSGDYSISISEPWIQESSSGTSAAPLFIVAENTSMFTRTGKITLSLNGISREITITQTGANLSIPDDQTGVEKSAMELAAVMGLGWNLGNSLEATNVGGTQASEIMWGNAKTSKAFIDAVKNAGFNAVRIPCAWNAYIEDQTTYKIKDSWLARVKEVVDYCIDNEMYVVLNIHWDGGWLENNPLYAKQVEVNVKQKALWEQIGVYFRDYDEHLLFAGTNEVHFDYNTPTTEHIEVQLSYNQTFVDAVRSTGGKNKYRNLIIQSYNTNIDLAIQHLVMPTDADGIADRLFVEVHYYDPYDFTLDDTSNKHLWGAEFAGSPNLPAWGLEAHVDATFDKVKTKFIDHNIPVIIGEYGATYRGNLATGLEDHKKSRANYMKYVTKAAVDRGIIPFYWDSGHTGTNGSGIFNRATGETVHADILQAIVASKNP